MPETAQDLFAGINILIYVIINILGNVGQYSEGKLAWLASAFSIFGKSCSQAYRLGEFEVIMGLLKLSLWRSRGRRNQEFRQII